MTTYFFNLPSTGPLTLDLDHTGRATKATLGIWGEDWGARIPKPSIAGVAGFDDLWDPVFPGECAYGFPDDRLPALVAALEALEREGTGITSARVCIKCGRPADTAIAREWYSGWSSDPDDEHMVCEPRPVDPGTGEFCPEHAREYCRIKND